MYLSAYYTMFSLSKLFKAAEPTVGCHRWSEFVPPEFIYLSEGKPVPTDVDKLNNWLKSYERWRASYAAFVRNEQALEKSTLAQDEADRRNREYYVALLLQSAQWHAILLLLVKDVSDLERSKQLAEIDVALAELRKRIANP